MKKSKQTNPSTQQSLEKLAVKELLCMNKNYASGGRKKYNK